MAVAGVAAVGVVGVVAGAASGVATGAVSAGAAGAAGAVAAGAASGVAAGVAVSPDDEAVVAGGGVVDPVGALLEDEPQPMARDTKNGARKRRVVVRMAAEPNTTRPGRATITPR